MRALYLKLFCGLLATFFTAHVFSQEKKGEDFRILITKNSAALGITPAEAAQAVITSGYTDERTGISHVYIQQSYLDIRVYNAIISVAFKNGSFLHAAGSFVKNMAGKAGTPVPVKTPADAVQSASRHLELKETDKLSIVKDGFASEKKYTLAAPEIARRDVDVTLYWQPSEDKSQVALAWNVNIDVLGRVDWWNVRIDARTGAYLTKDNWTVEEKTHAPETADAALEMMNTTFSQEQSEVNGT